MILLLLSQCRQLIAVSRMRSFQYLSAFEQTGTHVTVQILLSDDLLRLRYARGGYSPLSLLRAYADRLRLLMLRRQFDVVWIEKEASPWWPLWLELALLRRSWSGLRGTWAAYGMLWRWLPQWVLKEVTR